MAKNVGKIFEEEFKSSVDENIMYYNRIKDSATSFSGGAQTRFTLNNPYDCTVNYDFNTFAIELKSTKSTSIPFSRSKKDKKSIKWNQIIGLQKVAKYKDTGLHGLFVFNFRETEKRENITYALSIDDFMDFFNNSEKKSINEKDIVDFGGIVINNRKKKVYYKYDLKEYFDTIKLNVCFNNDLN